MYKNKFFEIRKKMQDWVKFIDMDVLNGYS